MAASGITVEDVGGSFAKFTRNAAPTLKKHLGSRIDKTAQAMVQRMKAMAPVGPDAPHIRDAIDYVRIGNMAEIGIIDGGQQAGPHNLATLADVALYNEYSPNRQPFMRPAAEQTDGDLQRNVTDAIEQMEQELSTGL